MSISSIDILGSIQRDCEKLAGTCATACIGACCMKDNVLELSAKEAEYMAGRGTGLERVAKSQMPKGYKVPRGKIAFALTTDCANLDPETRLCTDYENRPDICRSFQASNDEQSGCYNTRKIMEGRVESGVVELGMPVVPKFEAMVQDLGQKATWRTI